MFKKVLIANRGEVALRVIFACRELGIKTVAVFSEADDIVPARPVCRRGIRIGPPQSAGAATWTCRRFISAAEITDERRDTSGLRLPNRRTPFLAEVCEASHISSSGPPRVIRIMGDKARARAVMRKAGVPILPGSDGPNRERREGTRRPRDMGYPVIVKATAGGGGRGMRVVRGPGELSNAVKTAQHEAEAAFRRRRRLPRKIHRVAPPHRVPDPGRSRTASVHLGERECRSSAAIRSFWKNRPRPPSTDQARARWAASCATPSHRAVHERRHGGVPDG